VGDPIGQRLPLQLTGRAQPDWEIVGLVDDVRQDDAASESGPAFFVSYRQNSIGLAFDPMILLRTVADPGRYAAGLRRLVKEVDSALVVDSVATMDDRMARSLDRPRALALLVIGFASLALLVAGVGLYGVLSQTTAQRTAEIGLRLALGAARRDILGLVLRQVVVVVGLGLTAGLAVSAVAADSIAALLYGVAARDISSFAVAGILIAGVASVALVVPSRRAMRVDPLQALRSK
jgi:hypothetical protein